MRKLIILTLCLVAIKVVAQPTISNIDPESTFAGGQITISGTGFGTSAGDVIVWFGGVKSQNIIAVTETSVVAEVPAGAPEGPVLVQRVSSGLVGESSEDFFINYSGADFALSDIDNSAIFINSGIEYFDLCGCDFDGDNLVDFIVTETTGTEIAILTNTSTVGNVSFSSSTLNPGSPSTSASCGDLDGDGLADVAVTRSGANRNQVFLYRNTSTPGNVQFAALTTVNLDNGSATSENYQSIKVVMEDMNGDGKLDLVVTNLNDAARLLNVLLNSSSKGAISFGSPILVPTSAMNSNAGISTDDIDNDGFADLTLTTSGQSDIFIYRNTGSNAIVFQDPVIVSSDNASLINVGTFDLDADGKKEIVSVASLGDDVLIYKNNSTPGNPSFDAPITVSIDNDGGANPEGWAVDAADMNGDGLLDIIASHRNEYKFSVLINQGNLSFSSLQQPLSQATRNLYVGDIDGDAKSDVAFTCLEIPIGDFSVQVVRNENCYEPVFYDDAPAAICSGQSFVIGVPDNPGVTFSWKKDGVDMAMSDHEVTITDPGSYEVSAISEAGACSIAATLVVADGSGTIPTDPVATNGGPACEGQSVTLSVDTQSGATYSWTGPGGFASTEQNPVIENITQDLAGIYTVRVKIGDCLSSDAQTEVVVRGTESFSASAAGSTSICQGSTVAISTQERTGYSYLWYKDGVSTGSAGATYNATGSGEYYAIITDAGTGCEIKTNSVMVNVYTTPVASFTSSSPVCNGIETTFSNSSAVDAGATSTYTWDFGDGTSSSGMEVSHAFNGAGSYTVSLTVAYTDIAGCSDTFSEVISVVDATPVTIRSAQDVICDGEALDLTVEGSFNTIEWSNGDTGASSIISAPGSYSVTAIDVNGCVSTDDIAINAGTLPDITVVGSVEGGDAAVGSIEITNGEIVQLIASGADTYLWEPATYLSSPNISNPTSNPAEDITYNITGALADGCSASATFTISIVGGSATINIEPVAAFNPDNVNDPTWRVIGIENYPEFTMSIYDQRGTLVFREKGYSNADGWDGTSEGNLLPEGVYYFIFGNADVEPYTGTVLLVR